MRLRLQPQVTPLVLLRTKTVAVSVFSWQLPITSMEAWDQNPLLLMFVSYEVRYKNGNAWLNLVEFEVATDLVTVKTSTVIGTRTNQHLLSVGDEIVFAASSGSLPTGVVSGTLTLFASNGFTVQHLRSVQQRWRRCINFTGTATGTYKRFRSSGSKDPTRRYRYLGCWY